MTTSSLQEAHELLKIKNVYLRSSFITLRDDIDLDEIVDFETTKQSFRGVRKVRESSYSVDDNIVWEYSFFYSVGVRLLEKDHIENEENEGNEPLIEIKATFNAFYVSSQKLSKQQINAFSENNVGYHVWPYWRELVQSSCMRLNVEPIDIPFYFCKKETKNNEESPQ